MTTMAVRTGKNEWTKCYYEFAEDQFHMEVFAAPVPCARPRVTRNGTFLPARVRAYENKIKACAKAVADDRKWSVVPKASYEVKLLVHRAQLRGDWDNFAKALTDPLNGVVWHDDAQIVKATVEVLLDRKNPRAIVRVERRMG